MKILNITDDCFIEKDTTPEIDDENNSIDVFFLILLLSIPTGCFISISSKFSNLDMIKPLLSNKYWMNLNTHLIPLEVLLQDLQKKENQFV